MGLGAGEARDRNRLLPESGGRCTFGGRMNVHHLELFYYVATHGGISAAARQIPYGIQQPAISGQMGKLEEDLGVRLFERMPFRLTPAGEKLYAHVQPFFAELPTLAQTLRDGESQELRICGAELVLRDHLPKVLKALKKTRPQLRFSLRATGFQSQVFDWLRNSEADVAFLPVQDRAPAGLKMTKLASLPVVLQVPKASKLRTIEDLLQQKRIAETLICLDAKGVIVQRFLKELKARGVTWPHVTEASSLDLITRYVANGDGFGLNVCLRRSAAKTGVRDLALDGFSPLTMGALWRGKASPLVDAVIEGVRQHARATWPDSVHDRD
jgi:DNA-binding transcriptional LysR family regulator